MGKRETGLRRRGRIWWIEKQLNGKRIRESTRTCDYDEARRYLAFRLNQLRQTEVYGETPNRTFEQAAARYLLENRNKRSIVRDDQGLRLVMPLLGHLELRSIEYEHIERFVDLRLASGLAPATINRDLAPVKQVLKAAAKRRWLRAVPEIPRLDVPPHSGSAGPITLAEQERLLQALPAYLTCMALFAVNTGCRRGEVMALRWAWEVKGMAAFRIPPEYHKTGYKTGYRYVVCNSTAWSVVDSQRGSHPEFVFTRQGKPVKTFYGRAWKKARVEAGIPRVRVHDLRHTFATRLEACGVAETDVGLLLGHVSGGITRTYIAPDIERLLGEAEKIVGLKREPVLGVVG